MEPNEKKILIFTSLSHYLTHFYVLLFPALIMPMSRDFNVTTDIIISIGFPMYLLYGILAIPWGYLSDRFGYKRMMGIGIIIAGIGFIGAGLSNTIVMVTISLGITGIGCSAYHPSGLALLSKGMTKRGKAMGINGLFGNIGIASAPLAAGILNYFTGWQSTLLILGCCGIIAGLSIMASPFGVDRYEEQQKVTTVDKGSAVKVFAAFCVIMLFSGLMYRGFTLILPSYIEENFTTIMHSVSALWGGDFNNISIDKATLIATILTSLVFFIGMVGQIFGGRIADSKELRWSYLVFFCCAFPFLILVGLSTGAIIVAAAGLFAFFSLGLQPIENSLIAMVTPTQWRSVSYGIKFTLVFGAGSMAVIIASGIQKSFGTTMVVLSLLVPISILIVLILGTIWMSRGKEFRHIHEGEDDNE